jgi:ubiquinone/menaquinone biosynthesis C-methylase UbiE
VTTDAEKWQLEGSAAELYERYLVPAVTLPWAEDLLERVGPSQGERVLDVACGTGIVARVAAARVGDGGRVVGLDVNAGMLAVARATPSVTGGAAPEWVEGSAFALPFAEDEFDVVVCQLGLQFFEDRVGALREMHRVLVAGGRVGASVFSSLERNPTAHALSDAVDRHLGYGASLAKRSEHSLADSHELRKACAAAGFVEIRVETVTLVLRFASVEQWVGIQFAATPLAAQLREREPSESDAIVARVAADVGAALAELVRKDGFEFPQEVHVVLASGR